MSSNKRPLVTAIVTTHNRLDLLKRAIKSIQEQTYENIELIVVDDASEDGTESYCKSQSFSYIRIAKEDSRGGNYARNIGISKAKGEYIAFCDDDDYWLPSKVEKQLLLIEQTGCDFVHSARTAEIVEGNELRYQNIFPPIEADGDISKSILWNIYCFTITLFIRRNAILKVGGFDESLKAWQEYDLTIRLAQISETHYINEPLSVYRVDIKDPHRLTNKYYGWRDSVDLIYQKHRSLYSRLSFKEKLRVRSLKYSDGIGRARASGLRFHFIKNRILLRVCNLFAK